MQVIDPYGDHSVGRFMALEPDLSITAATRRRQQHQNTRLDWVTVRWIRARFYELTQPTRIERIVALRQERPIPVCNQAIIDILKNKSWIDLSYKWKPLPVTKRYWSPEARERQSMITKAGMRRVKR